MIQDPWVKGFDTIDKEFQKLTGATVVVDSFSYDDVHQKEVLMGNNKSDSYDIVVLDSPWVGEFQQGGYVEDLKPYVEKDSAIIAWDDFVPSFQQVATWKGQYVGIPFGAYFVMFNYRTDLFQQAALQPPKTIEDFFNAAKTFTKNPKFPGMFGTALNNQRGAAVGQAYFEYIFNFGGKPFVSMYPGSPDPYADMTPLLTSPGKHRGRSILEGHVAIPAARCPQHCLGPAGKCLCHWTHCHGRRVVGARTALLGPDPQQSCR
jgi:multiple sugar transport system substrate-binding protein